MTAPRPETGVAPYVADADLIETCTALAAIEAEYDTIYATIDDDDEADRAFARRRPRWDELRKAVDAAPLPVTTAGMRALAAAALALAPRSAGGDILHDGNLCDRLVWRLAAAMTGTPDPGSLGAAVAVTPTERAA